jgi:Ca2+-binding RTX toxin-like protein
MKSWLPSVSRHRGAPQRLVRFLVASLALGAVALPASAIAGVTIGATGGNGAADCPADFTWAQDSTAVGSPTYVVPAGGGVITSWSHDRGPALATAQLRLKVFRKTAPNSYLTVGQSDFETLAAAGVNTFATRVEVEGGDILGFRFTAAPISCRRSGSTGDVAVASGPAQPDPPIGSMVSFGTVGAFLLNLAATVEPDCDDDGLGDESQDMNIVSCAPPCKGQTPTIAGTNGSNKLSGTPGRDVIVGLGGKDKLSGLAGDDLICGGPGKDMLKGGAGKDTLLGQGGKDQLKGGGGKDLCKGGKGTDTASKCEAVKSI